MNKVHIKVKCSFLVFTIYKCYKAKCNWKGKATVGGSNDE